jgi:hypothetical protein
MCMMYGWKSAIHAVWLTIFIGWMLMGQAHGEQRPPLDAHIDGLERVRLLAGTDARHAINKLHGMSIDMARGFVAFYQSRTGHKATVWVSEGPSEALAAKQIDIMLDKMKGNDRSPFKKYRTIEAQGAEVIGFDGLGQVHYVFRVGKWVYWISADEKQADLLLRHITKKD